MKTHMNYNTKANKITANILIILMKATMTVFILIPFQNNSIKSQCT